MRILKQQAGYRARAKTRKCMNCVHFVKPDKCKIVIGKISPNGTSNYWRKR